LATCFRSGQRANEYLIPSKGPTLTLLNLIRLQCSLVTFPSRPGAAGALPRTDLTIAGCLLAGPTEQTSSFQNIFFRRRSFGTGLESKQCCEIAENSSVQMLANALETASRMA